EGTAEAAGRIAFTIVAGTEVKIGQVVATIDTDVSRPKSAVSPAPDPANPKSEIANQKSGETVTSPAVRRLAAETGLDPATVAGTGKAGRVTKGDMLAASEPKP